MGEHLIKMPDVGEGIAEAELVEWHVKIGDLVREDAVLAAVMTDKATVEIPSPVDGEILWLGAEIGDTVAIGSPLIRLKVETERAAAPDGGRAGTATRGATGTARGGQRRRRPRRPARRHGRQPRRPRLARDARLVFPSAAPAAVARAEGERPIASPAVRLRAREAGIDLRQVPGLRSRGPHHP